MTKQTKTKPKCIKGTACGYSCISSKRNCSDRIKANDAAELLASVQAKPKAKSEPDTKAKASDPVDMSKITPFKGLDPSHTQTQVLDVPPDKVKVKMGRSYYSDIEEAVEINIYVNDSINSERSNVIDTKQALKVAMTAMRNVKEMVAKMPDGTLLSNTPSDGDGRGDARASLYAKAGFSPVDKSFIMYAVVIGGKIKPASKEYLRANYRYGG
jgi:hypothetical protein